MVRKEEQLAERDMQELTNSVLGLFVCLFS